jgi:ankyrin repeat protein
MTPLHYTVTHNRNDIARRLLQSGVPIDIGIERRTWTRKFQDGCNVYELRDDIDPLPAIQISGFKGLTPLHYAAIVGNSKMTGVFLRHGANPNALSYYDETPLHLSLCRSVQGSKYYDAWTDEHLRVEVLWDFVDLEEDNVEEASAETRMAVVNAILSHSGTDVTVQDSQGREPLHTVRYGDPASQLVVSKLIESGAKVSACNLKGRTALHLASLAEGSPQPGSRCRICGQ